MAGVVGYANQSDHYTDSNTLIGTWDANQKLTYYNNAYLLVHTLTVTYTIPADTPANATIICDPVTEWSEFLEDIWPGAGFGYTYKIVNNSLIIKKITKEQYADFVVIFDENATKSIKKETEKLQKKIKEQSLKNQALDNLSYMQSAANLNLKYKFENYIVGETNDFAYKVAMAVAQNPGKKYNPLFIYGKSGLGKTHLMQAIGHYTIFNNPNLKVKYTKTEDYINDFITNTRFTKEQVENMSKFNKKYTNIDIILIDDIQFIEGKGKTMTQMQHTFDKLHNKGKQIVITSDRLPEDIPKIANALKTRFEMGLMVELVPPDTKLRFDILKKLAKLE